MLKLFSVTLSPSLKHTHTHTRVNTQFTEGMDKPEFRILEHIMGHPGRRRRIHALSVIGKRLEVGHLSGFVLGQTRRVAVRCQLDRSTGKLVIEITRVRF